MNPLSLKKKIKKIQTPVNLYFFSFFRGKKMSQITKKPEIVEVDADEVNMELEDDSSSSSSSSQNGKKEITVSSSHLFFFANGNLHADEIIIDDLYEGVLVAELKSHNPTLVRSNV